MESGATENKAGLEPSYNSPSSKLLKQGVDALSDTELLSLFMNENIELARRALLFNGQSLRELFRARPDEFEVLGVSQDTYIKLQAILELSRRNLQEKVTYGNALSDPDAVKAFLISHLRHCRSELFCVLFLDNQHRLITFKKLFKGTIDETRVYPREVLTQCIAHNAKAVIFAHNHPSGNSEPSQADERITGRLTETLSLIDVRVLDHFVVGEKVTSFAERGLI